MSTNFYRRTESFFRKLEPILLEATLIPTDEWAVVPPKEWTAITLVKNLTFSTRALIENKWPTKIDINELASRYLSHLFTTVDPSPLNAQTEPCVIWQHRKKLDKIDHISFSLIRKPFTAPPKKLSYSLFNEGVERTAGLNLSINDIETVKAVIHLLYTKVHTEAVMFWGTATEAHRSLCIGDIQMIQMFDNLGKPYVVIA